MSARSVGRCAEVASARADGAVFGTFLGTLRARVLDVFFGVLFFFGGAGRLGGLRATFAAIFFAGARFFFDGFFDFFFGAFVRPGMKRRLPR